MKNCLIFLSSFPFADFASGGNEVLKINFCFVVNSTARVEKYQERNIEEDFARFFLKAQKRFQENLPLKRKYSGKVFAV